MAFEPVGQAGEEIVKEAGKGLWEGKAKADRIPTLKVRSHSQSNTLQSQEKGISRRHCAVIRMGFVLDLSEVNSSVVYCVWCSLRTTVTYDNSLCLSQDILTAEKRAVRKSLISTNYPCLVEAYQEGKARKAPTTPTKRRGGKRKPVHMRPLEVYFGAK